MPTFYLRQFMPVVVAATGALIAAMLAGAPQARAQSNNLDWTNYALGAAEEWDYVGDIAGTGADTTSNTFTNVDGSGVDVTLQFDPVRGTTDTRSTDGTLPDRDTLDEMLNIDAKHTGIFTLFTYPNGPGETLNFGFGESDRDDCILATFTFSSPVLDVTFDAIDIDKSNWTGDPGVEVSGRGDGWIDQLTFVGYLGGQPVYPVFGTIPAGTNNPAANWYNIHGFPNPNDYIFVTGANNNVLEGRWEFSEKGSFGTQPDDGGTWATDGTYGADMANVKVSFPSAIDSFTIHYENIWSIPGNDDRTNPNEYWGGHSQETGIGDIGFTPYICTLDFTDGAGGAPGYQVGDAIFITAEDLIYNTDPGVAETITVTLTNDRTGETEEVVLTETGLDTGLFASTVGFPTTDTGSTANNDGTLNVQFGDTVTATSLTGGTGEICSDTYRFPVPTDIQKSVDNTEALPGETLTYTIDIGYPAGDVLTNVNVTDNVPTGTTYVAASATAGGSESGGTVTWNLGSTVAGTTASQAPGLGPFSALEDITNDLGGQNSVDPAVAIDAGGNYHVVFEGKATGASRVNIYYINNVGGTWSVPVPLSDDTDGQDARDPDIAIDGSGTLHVVFTDKSTSSFSGEASNDDRRNVYYRTITGTGTLSSPLRLSDDGDGQDAQEPVVAASSTGVASVVFTDKSTAAWSGESSDDGRRNAYYLAVSGGTAGSPLRLSDDTDGQDATGPDVAVDSTGTAHVVFDDMPDSGWTGLAANDAKRNVYYRSVTGTTPSAPVRLSDDTDGQDADQAAVAVDGNDAVHVVYVDKQTGDAKRNVYYTENTSGSFAVPVDVTADFSGQDSFNPVIGIDVQGAAHVSFENVGSTGGQMDIFYLNNQGGSFGAPVQFTDNLDGQASLNPEMAVDSNSVCVFFDARDPADSDRNIYNTCADLLVGTTMSVSASPAIAMTGDTVTVTAVLTATEDLSGVLPVLTPSATNNMGVSLVSSPAAQDLTANGAAQFVWTYTVTEGASATPGQLTFQATATNNDPTFGLVDFGTADSNSLIATPPLEFKVTVDAGAPNPVQNSASISDSTGFIPLTESNIVATKTAPTGAIGNYVWLDEDGDGVQDAGERGIAGVTVELYDATGTILLATTSTDADGGYIFTSLPPGDYTVKIDGTSLDPALNLTGDPDGTLDGEHAVSLAAGEEYLTADFGYNYVPSGDSTSPSSGATGAIGDTVWNDADGDGVQDPGESGIGGVTVSLYTDDNGDGVYGGPGDNPPLTTTTDADGSYIFDGLDPGSYVVEVTAPAGYTQTGDPDGTLDGATTSPIVLAPGDVFTNADFGYDLDSGGATIGDTIYFDANADGSYDPAVDRGIAGVTVALLDAAGNVIATTTTDQNGNYSFPGLPTGVDYSVVVTDTDHVLGGLVQSGDPDGTLDGESTVTGLAADDLNQDFGYTEPGHGSGDGIIGDTIYLDTDSSGDYTAGEGVEGITVELWDSTGTALLATTTTDENGNYHFGGLDPAGTYTVKVDTTGTVLDATTNFDDPDGGTANESVVDLSVDADGIVLDQDFGYAGTNTIGGTIWEDTDADATLDEAGTGLAGVTVVLLDSDGNVVATTITGPDGSYSFTNLPDGTYTVDVTDDSNVLDGYWHSESADQVSDGESKSDLYSVTVSGGTTDTTADFGYYIEPARLGDFVWHDLDRDGIQDGNEPGIEGVAVTLTITYPNGDTVVLTTTTDASGYYSFDALLLDESYAASGGAGEPTYTVTAATPDRYAPSPSNQGADDTVDSDNSVTGEDAELVQGGEDLTNDFGFVKLKATNYEDFITDAGLDPATADGQPLPDGSGNGGNPDGDWASNLLEHAFCDTPISGVPNHQGFCVELANAATGQMDVTFIRAEGIEDVIYTLQGSDSMLGPWFDIGTIAAGAPAASGGFTAVSNGDETETVTYANVQNDAGYASSGFGFARLCVSLDADQNGVPDTVILPSDGSSLEATDYTRSFGWQCVDYNQSECASFSHPYTNKPVFTGTVVGNTAANATIDATTSAGGVDLATLDLGPIDLDPGAGVQLVPTHYLQISSGPLEGERFDIAAASGAVLILVNDPDIFTGTSPALNPSNPTVDSLNTSNGVPADDVLLGASFQVLPHKTIDQLFDKNGAFAGLQSTSDETRLLFYDNRNESKGFATLSLADTGSGVKWVYLGDAEAIDQGRRPVDRCTGSYIHSLVGATTVCGIGLVADYDLACAFDEGYNLAGAPYPLDQTPTGVNGRAMEIGGAADQFHGGAAPNQAAEFLVWLGDATVDELPAAVPYLEGYESFMAADDGGSFQRWVDPTDPALADLGVDANGPLLLRSWRAVTVKMLPGNILAPHIYPLPETP